MGTRADFYVRKENMEWLGSIAWDGYPKGIPRSILTCKDEDVYRCFVTAFLKQREDATFPEDGWPWPWDDSGTTDFAYTFADGEVWYSLGYPKSYWWKADGLDPTDEEYENLSDECHFPNMSAIKNVALGSRRSGLIVVSV